MLLCTTGPPVADVPAGPGLKPAEEGRLAQVHLGRNPLLVLIGDLLLQQADRSRVPAERGVRERCEDEETRRVIIRTGESRR